MSENIELDLDEPTPKKSIFSWNKAKPKAEKAEKALPPPKPAKSPSLPKLKALPEKKENVTVQSTEPLKPPMTTKQKWYVVMAVGAVGIGVVSVVMSPSQDARKPNELANSGSAEAGPVVNLDLTPKTLDNNSGLRRVQTENSALKERLDKLERNGLEVTLKSPQAQAAAAALVPPPQPRLRDPNALPVTSSSPITAQNPLMGTQPQPAPTQAVSFNPATAEVKRPPALAPEQTPSLSDTSFTPAPVAAATHRALVFTPPPLANATAATGEGSATGSALAASDVKVKVKYEANPMAGMLPMGHVPVVLLNGADVPMSATQAAQPAPVLLRIMDNSWVPNEARYHLKGCFLLASLTGEASSERAKGRTVSIQCVDTKNQTMLTADVEGYLVDNDSQLGLRGEVENRQGAKIMAATLSSFATGMSSAFGAAAGTANTLATGAVSTQFSGKEAVNKSLFGGAAEATKQYSDFLLKQAEQIFPVLVVPSGRIASVVFIKPVTLTWKSYATQFERKLTPDNKN